MDLAQLQVKLRSLQNQMESLGSEIEKMKSPTNIQEKSRYEIITELAYKYPIKNQCLVLATETVKRNYIKLLAYLCILQEINLTDQLLFITRIAAGLGDSIYTAEYLYKQGCSFNNRELFLTCSELEEVKHSLVTDALIMGNISGYCSDTIITLATDIAIACGCSKEEICVCATMAKAVLTDQFDLLNDLPCSLSVWYGGKFMHYIPQKWLIKNRTFCGRYCTNRGITLVFYKQSIVESRIQAGTVVQKGDKLVIYREFSCDINKKVIYAEKQGLVFYQTISMKNKDTGKDEQYEEVYVVSIFDDYTSFCDWLSESNN